MKPRDQIPNGDLTRPDAGGLAGSAVGGAGVMYRQPRRRRFFIIKPDAAQQSGRIRLSAGFCAQCVLTERAAEHIAAKQFFSNMFSLLFRLLLRSLLISQRSAK